MNRSHNIGTDRIGGSCSGNAKICYLHLSVCGNDNILRLHITVNNSMIVGCLQSHGNLDCNTGRLFNRKLSFFCNIFLQGDSLYQFHDNVINAFIIAYVKYINNIRMCQSGCCLSLASEFPDKGFVLPKFRLQHLNRNKTVQLMILCFIHIGHAACAYFP